MKIQVLILLLTASSIEVDGQQPVCNVFQSPMIVNSMQGTITSSIYMFNNKERCFWRLMPPTGIASILRIDINGVQLNGCSSSNNGLIILRDSTAQHGLCQGSTNQCFVYSYSETSAQCQTHIAQQNCMLTANLSPAQQPITLEFNYLENGWDFTLNYTFIQCTEPSTTIVTTTQAPTTTQQSTGTRIDVTTTSSQVSSLQTTNLPSLENTTGISTSTITGTMESTQLTTTNGNVQNLPTSTIIIISASAATGLLFLLGIIILICCLVKRRDSKQRKSGPRDHKGNGGDVIYDSPPNTGLNEGFDEDSEFDNEAQTSPYAYIDTPVEGGGKPKPTRKAPVNYVDIPHPTPLASRLEQQQPVDERYDILNRIQAVSPISTTSAYTNHNTYDSLADTEPNTDSYDTLNHNAPDEITNISYNTLNHGPSYSFAGENESNMASHNSQYEFIDYDDDRRNPIADDVTISGDSKGQFSDDVTRSATEFTSMKPSGILRRQINREPSQDYTGMTGTQGYTDMGAGH